MVDFFFCVMILFLFSPIPSRRVPEPTMQIMSFLKFYKITKSLKSGFSFKMWSLLIPVHCPSVTSIQGPSILSSEKITIKFWKPTFVCFYRKSNIWCLPILQLSVCCTKGFLWTELLCLIFAPLRTYTISCAQEEHNNFFTETYIEILQGGKNRKILVKAPRSYIFLARCEY